MIIKDGAGDWAVVVGRWDKFRKGVPGVKGIAYACLSWRRPQFYREQLLCRYNWHSAVFLGWPFPVLKYKCICANKKYGSNFIKQHSETVMV